MRIGLNSNSRLQPFVQHARSVSLKPPAAAASSVAFSRVPACLPCLHISERRSVLARNDENKASASVQQDNLVQTNGTSSDDQQALSASAIVQGNGKEASPSVDPTSSVEDVTVAKTAAVVALPSPEPTKAETKKEPPKSQFKPVNAIICVAIGLAVRFLIPIPDGLSSHAWTLLAVFVSTISGLVLEPLPVGAWSMCCVTVLLATKAVTFQQAFSGLTNEAIWLIVFAFFFAKAFEKTGLGERVANLFVSAVGHSTLGVAYSLAIAEALMAPAMPSCTARAGGVFMPVIKFLSAANGSEPTSGRRKIGAFLVHTQMQVSPNVAALFMTAAAQNLLAINIARSMGVVIPDVWTKWFMGAIVPSVLSVITIPLLVYKLVPPEITATPDAPKEAKQRLIAMGPLSRSEAVTLVTLAGAVVIWSAGEAIGISAVQGAMMALCSLLVTGVLTWKDCLEYTPAWDTLVWFSLLMGMCSAMTSVGLIGRLAEAVGGALAAANLPWITSFTLLHLVFFWSHYFFASQVGHVGALYGAFLAMMLGAGAPPAMAAITLGYSANLFGSLTHYASGPSAVFYGSGYLKLKEVMTVGALMGLRSWLVWGVLGMAWWKVLGWY